MMRFCFAYRHNDGAIRAYIGYGFADYSARNDAIANLRAYCNDVGESPILCGPVQRCIMGKGDCHKGEYAAIKRQWASMIKARLDAGASIA